MFILLSDVLDHYPSWIFILLAHWNNSPRIDMSLHLDTLSWFRANQSLVFCLNAVCLTEKQQLPSFIVFCLTCLGLEPTIYLRCKHNDHYTTDAVSR